MVAVIEFSVLLVVGEGRSDDDDDDTRSPKILPLLLTDESVDSITCICGILPN